MAFSSETKIFTSQGWKYISDLRGNDRVLVRNFLGDAEFIQPFALRRKEYEGEVVKFGGKYWAVTVTPDHKIVYDKRPDGQETFARDVVVDKHRHLYRKFRYIREDKADEKLILRSGNTERVISLADKDWYTLVAYTVMKGYISKDTNPRLKFFLDMSNVLPMIDILDRLGITWSSDKNDDQIVITVNRDNNLARKLKLFLGARKRKYMYLPDKMLYGSSQSLMKHFMSIITSLVAKPSQNRPNQLVFTSTNRKLIETLRLLCMMVGYGFSVAENHGELVVAVIPRQVSPWSVRFLEKQLYSGYIYEIDLFDGLVYVTEKSLPVWMSPK